MTRWVALGASLLVLLSACGTGGGSKPTIKIGSDGFYEAKLVAEIYAQALEANGYTVDRTAIGIGARKVSAPALESGQFDLKPEYIGSGLAFYEPPNASPAPGASAAPSINRGDPAAVAAELQSVLKTKGGGITVLNYSPAADQNAFVVTQATATKYNLKTMSDLGKVAGQLKLGVATDCPTNPVCGAALKSAYGIDVSNATLLAACDTPMAQALKGGTIDVGELCSTQPDIAVNNWVVLQDDKQTQPADNLAPLVRDSLLTALGSNADAFKKVLNDVSAALDTTTLTELGKEFTVDKQNIADIAKAWLQSKGLVPGGSGAPASS
ncbi:MAG TPA: ABC transporter substrate-binding protein [Candidatus Limnocylindrales bacterium]|nr:ABC transporter substrate-binding protein [Candidatus Limnocylindrales bacterium]